MNTDFIIINSELFSECCQASNVIHNHINKDDLILLLNYFIYKDVSATEWPIEIQQIFFKICFDPICRAKFLTYCPLFILLIDNHYINDSAILDIEFLRKFLLDNPVIYIELNLLNLIIQDIIKENLHLCELLDNNNIKIPINILYNQIRSNWLEIHILLDFTFKNPNIDILQWKQIVHFQSFNKLFPNTNIQLFDDFNILNKSIIFETKINDQIILQKLKSF